MGGADYVIRVTPVDAYTRTPEGTREHRRVLYASTREHRKVHANTGGSPFSVFIVLGQTKEKKRSINNQVTTPYYCNSNTYHRKWYGQNRFETTVRSTTYSI